MKIRTLLLLVAAGALAAVSCAKADSSRADLIAGPLQDEIIRKAEADLTAEPVTITAFPAAESKGGLHDFFSEADYSWPDPANPGGPYIGRDGYSYMDNFRAHRNALNRMSVIVGNLASAWILTGDRKYADAILPHVRAWFVDEETMMNPNALYAQAVHGKFDGRSYGIIDTIHLIEVFKALSRMEEAGLVDQETLDKTKSWCWQYCDWLTSHPQGIAELRAGNNHGVCWAMQVAMFAQYAGWTELVEFAKIRFKYKYLPEMAQDGSFPMEIERTKGYGYSLFNLDAMVGLCQILSTPEDDLWSFVTDNGRTIRQALDFMFPYIQDTSTWIKEPDVTHWEDWPVAQPSLIFAWNRFRGEKDFDAEAYYQTWLGLEHFPTDNEVIRNLPLRNPVLWLL